MAKWKPGTFSARCYTAQKQEALQEEKEAPSLPLGPLFCCTANVKPAIASGPLREQPITRPVIWFPQNERAARLPFERPSAASFGGIGDWVKRPNYKRATPQFCFNLLGYWPDRVGGLIGCGEDLPKPVACCHSAHSRSSPMVCRLRY